MKCKPCFIVFLVLLAFAIGGSVFILSDSKSKPPTITNFEECAAAGNTVMESYPRQCAVPGGETFVEDITIPIDRNGGDTDKSTTGDCIITGCSGHVCSEVEVITTCEYREEYACYNNATCERQNDGECGWTLTSKLEMCLADSL